MQRGALVKNIDVVKKVVEEQVDEAAFGVWLQMHTLQIMLSMSKELDDERLKKLVEDKLGEAVREWGEMEVRS